MADTRCLTDYSIPTARGCMWNFYQTNYIYRCLAKHFYANCTMDSVEGVSNKLEASFLFDLFLPCKNRLNIGGICFILIVNFVRVRVRVRLMFRHYFWWTAHSGAVYQNCSITNWGLSLIKNHLNYNSCSHLFCKPQQPMALRYTLVAKTLLSINLIKPI